MEDKEVSGDSEKAEEQPWKAGQGGSRATLFIYVFTALENMGFVANMSSMVLYFLLVMHFDISGSANTLTNFMGTTFLLSLVGGFISDTYLSRLNTSLIFGAVEVLGLMIITYQAHNPKLHPEPCSKSHCIKGREAVLFYTSLGLYALGAGGVRGALPSLGGDQFNSKDPKESKSLASYFNWLVLSVTLGASLGVTIVVKIGMDNGPDVAFFIGMLAAFVALVVLAIGKPFYRLRRAGKSPILSILQVIVVAFKNRQLKLPDDTDELYEVNDKGTSDQGYEKLPITHQFRFLEKAAILGSKEDDAVATNPWHACTVTQVEEVKILTRMLPIIASTIIMNTCLAQLQTFSVQQGNAMNLLLGKLKVPPPSIPVIPLVFMSILIPIYEFVFIPIARKITHHPAGITQLQRVGVGLVLSAISMAVAAIVEVKRRNQDIKYNSKNNISLFWLSFQYGIFGIADMFTLVGLMDFFYKEAPSSMKSLSTSFTFLSLSIGYYLSSVIVSVINSITGTLNHKGGLGWLSAKTLNQNRLDLFYWFLAILSCINFVNYLFWASWYKYKSEDKSDFQIVQHPNNKEQSIGQPFEAKEITPSSLGHHQHLEPNHTTLKEDN